MLDSAVNLCELFPATVSEGDVKLFKYYVQETKLKSTGLKWTGTIIEVQVDQSTNFQWSHGNLEDGRSKGREAAQNGLRVLQGQNPSEKER